MNRVIRSNIKERILGLARLRSTGTPAELASRFDISVRSIKRIVRELRAEGHLLRYDYNCVSYVL